MEIAAQLLLCSPTQELVGIPAGRRAQCTAGQLHPWASHHASRSLCRGSALHPAEQAAPHMLPKTIIRGSPCCLQVEVPRLQRAISVACRLGFAKRLPNRNEGGGSGLHPAWLALVLLAGCAGLCLSAEVAPHTMLSSSSPVLPAAA